MLSNGDVEFAICVTGVNEIKRRVYSWHPNIEVIETAWLRQQIKKEITSSAKKHA